MTTLSSHLLNGVTGQHAANVEVTIYKLDKDDPTQREKIVQLITDEQGRFKVDLPTTTETNQSRTQFEMIVSLDGLFESDQTNSLENAIHDIVIRFSVRSHQNTQHIPIIISANSYSVWWSNP